MGGGDALQRVQPGPLDPTRLRGKPFESFGIKGLKMGSCPPPPVPLVVQRAQDLEQRQQAGCRAVCGTSVRLLTV